MIRHALETLLALLGSLRPVAHLAYLAILWTIRAVEPERTP